jgi:hypothetical protein
MSDVQQRIDDLVKGNRVVLFMKGTAQFPMCGFSGRAVQVLKACGANDLKTFNVLEDEESARASRTTPVAHDPAALRRRRVRRRLGHHDGDVPVGRTAAGCWRKA